MRKKVHVVYGGMSVERPVSLRSGKAVIAALEQAGFEPVPLDMKSLDDLHSLPNDVIILPILHGAYGEDGAVQEILESKSHRFLGSNSTSSRDSFNKAVTKEKLRSAKLPVAQDGVITREQYESHDLVKRPHVIKVTRGGSSIGTHVAREPGQVKKEVLDALFALDEQALIEEFIDGIEVTVPILGSSALPVIEILPPESGEFDYENKYNGKTKELCPAPSLSEELQNECQQLALRVHELLGCRHLSRVDMMIDKDKKPKILEINTMPGLADVSLYPIAAQVAGYSMPQLVTEFVRMIETDTY